MIIRKRCLVQRLGAAWFEESLLGATRLGRLGH